MHPPHVTGQHLVRRDPALTMLNTPSSRWGFCALLLGPHASSDGAVKNRHVGIIEVCSGHSVLTSCPSETSRARRDRGANHQGENSESESVPTRSVSPAGAVPRLLAAKNGRWGRDGPDLHGGHGVSPSIAHGERQKYEHPLVASTRGSYSMRNGQLSFLPKAETTKRSPSFGFSNLSHWLPGAQQ